MERKMTVLTLGLYLLLLLAGLFPTAAENMIYEDVLRLHVIAQDDSAEAQSIKLLVRDEMLKQTETLLAGCKTAAQAEQRARENASQLCLAAQRVLESQGAPYGAQVRVCRTSMDTRTYGGLTLPAGQYTCVQVILGEGKGQNYWCVLFPRLCGREEIEDRELLDAGLTENEVELLRGDRPKYTVRFKLLEWGKKLHVALKKLFRK
ncbi:MAG: stage II sporulation protein R [Clostridia bacterium]|nr:stage II sporulation protein R [Clostridia bacterium]